MSEKNQPSYVRKMSKEEVLDIYFECLEIDVERSDLIDAKIALSVIMQKSLHDHQRKQFDENKREGRPGKISAGTRRRFI